MSAGIFERPLGGKGEPLMKRDETILLVEDNPDDELLTRRS
jgi:hypothetical protein